MSDAGDRLSDLFTGQAILNASFGVVVGCVLTVVGVPNAPLWGVVAFVMRFVPFVGSYIAAVPPILLAAALIRVGRRRSARWLFFQSANRLWAR
jgi:predicted PurR-regulated permease PerM